MGKYILILTLLASLFTTQATAQHCPWATNLTTDPSLLALLNGHATPPANPFLQTPEPMLPDSIPADSTARAAYLSTRTEQGIRRLAQDQFAPAAIALAHITPADTACGLIYYRLAAQYVHRFQGTTPIFPGFNGGFYNFLKDSLQSGQKLTLPQYQAAIQATTNWLTLSQGKSIPAFELLGDLLYRHPDRFIGNYFGALVYMKAALLSKSPATEAFLEKGIYALEAPAESRKRFDQYLYTQLQKALQADLSAQTLETPEATPANVQQGGILYLSTKDGGRVGAILFKAYQQAQAQKPTTPSRFGPEVDAREVKKDNQFNLYALLLIGTVLGAIVFFWIRLRRANRA